MSGLFTAHVACPSCALTGPAFDAAPSLFQPKTLDLPTAKTDPPRFGAITVELGPEPWDVEALVRSSTTDTLQVANARLRDEKGQSFFVLFPPLCCPRCGAEVSRAKWGGPPLNIVEVTSLDQVVAQTRARSANETRRFGYEGITIICVPFDEEGCEANEWRIMGRGSVVNVAREIVMALERMGSRCDEPSERGSGRRSSFIEWVDDRS